jgi:Flp pilus assembly protein TadD
MTLQEAFNVAAQHHRAGQLPEAEGLYRQILAHDPNHADALQMLGVLANQAGRADEASRLIQRSIEIAPGRAGYYSNLGLVLAGQRKWQDAVAAFEKSIDLQPGLANAQNNLGNVLKELGRVDEAGHAYCQAIAIQPDHADALNNLGNIYQERQQPAEAIAAYQRALELKPEFVEAQVALGSTLLLAGDFARGWPAYEARWKAAGRSPNRGFAQPIWDGSDLMGKSILLHAEQGLGDTVQFIRYVSAVRARGAGAVHVLCPRELRRLLAGQAGIDRVSSDESALPPFEIHCPLLSLPRILGTTLETIPAQIPYLSAESAQLESWRGRLSMLARARNVGLVWAGSAAHVNDRNRSMQLADLSPLAKSESRFFSLQKGEPAIQARVPVPGMALVDWTDELDDLAQTAALISNLDLVISVDTAVAHLAGALGKPTWLMLPAAPDWRWMWGRTDSPWYPTMKLFRQPARGDWNTVIQRIVGELQAISAT